MFKNVASQTLTLSAFDSATGTQKTGDAANLIFYVDKDDAGPNAITSNSGVPSEISSTNAKGDYKIALSQGETNGDKLHFTGKSSTSGIVVVSKTIYTVPPNFTAFGLDSSGRVDIGKLLGTAWLTPGTAGTPDVNVKLAGGTAWNSGAIGASTLASDTIAAAKIASGAITAAKFAADAIDSNALAASAVTEIHASDADTSGVTTLLSRLSSARAGYLDNINNSALQTTVAQTGDSYARLGAPAGASIAADLVVIDDFVDALESRLTAARAGYLDNINNAALAALTDSTIADQVWDEILSGHAVSGSTGEALSAAGGAGDPWITALPGSYTAGQAGYILGTNLNALISSRMATFTLPTNFSSLLITGGGFAAADLQSINGDSTAADNAEAFFDGTGYAGTNNVIPTVTNLTNLPTMPTDWLTGTGLAASAVSEIQSGVSTLDEAGVRTALGLASANLDTQLSGIPAAVFASTVETGVSFMQCVRALGAMAGGKRSNAGTISEQVDALGNPGTARMVSNLDESANGTPTLTLGA